MTTTIYNINLLGDAGVGKTSWIRRMTPNTFQPQYIASVGETVYHMTANTNYGLIELKLNDYGGQDKYSQLLNTQNSDANVLIFDLTSPISRKNLKHWYEKCNKESAAFVVGNKCDIEEIKVDPTFHEKHNLPYLALSAKRMSGREFLNPILQKLTGHDDLTVQ
jgi:small GTP-binding protein